MAAGATKSAGDGGSYANSHELEGMYEHIEQTLDRIGLLRPTSRNHWMRSIRQFLSRTKIKKKEASLIRGVCRKFLQQSDGLGWLPLKRPEPPSD
jgi:tRNA C32,U32 (ribose-2'-O)-methylase TrmJ